MGFVYGNKYWASCRAPQYVNSRIGTASVLPVIHFEVINRYPTHPNYVVGETKKYGTFVKWIIKKQYAS